MGLAGRLGEVAGGTGGHAGGELVHEAEHGVDLQSVTQMLWLEGDCRWLCGPCGRGAATGKGIEIKDQDSPRLTRSMRIAMDDLKPRGLLVACPGSREYVLAENIRAQPLARVRASAVGGGSKPWKE